MLYIFTVNIIIQEMYTRLFLKIVYICLLISIKLKLYGKLEC